jgi:PHD/YefM family antitoxin component YafN of YafNO toxin-antitoxin module
LEACVREPVVIQRQKRDVAVVISVQEYERLTRVNVAEFQRFCDAVGERAAQAGLNEEKLAALLADA